jgi:hypothetical protein
MDYKTHMQKKPSIEEVKQIAFRLHCGICSRSKSPEVNKYGSLALKQNIQLSNSDDERYSVSIYPSTIEIYKDTGLLASYGNSVRETEQRRNINRDKPFIIRNREAAIQWANYYKPLFRTPPNAKLLVNLLREGQGADSENPAGAISLEWEYPCPEGYNYYWDHLEGREKRYWASPGTHITIDPLDGTLVSAGAAWGHLSLPIVFRKPVVKISKEQAIAIAQKIVPQAVKMRFESRYNNKELAIKKPRYAENAPSFGSTPHVELCYKLPLLGRYYLKNNKVVYEVRPKNTMPRPKVMEYVLVWNVRYGAYKRMGLPCTEEINIDATTGEIVDDGRLGFE